ncbi:hypothetical protein ACU8KH_03341 [Lachancea thermotolerans]
MCATELRSGSVYPASSGCVPQQRNIGPLTAAIVSKFCPRFEKLAYAMRNNALFEPVG